MIQKIKIPLIGNPLNKNRLWIIWVKEESLDSDKQKKKRHKQANHIQIKLQNVISSEHKAVSGADAFKED